MFISVSASLCSVNIFNIFWSLIISLSVHFKSEDGAFFTLSFLSLWPIFDLLCCFPLHARLTFHQARRVETRREQNLRWNDSSIRPHSPRFSTPLPWSPLLLVFLPLSFHLLSFRNPVLLYSTWVTWPDCNKRARTVFAIHLVALSLTFQLERVLFFVGERWEFKTWMRANSLGE